jgi:hypothetical protein
VVGDLGGSGGRRGGGWGKRGASLGKMVVRVERKGGGEEIESSGWVGSRGVLRMGPRRDAVLREGPTCLTRFVILLTLIRLMIAFFGPRLRV